MGLLASTATRQKDNAKYSQNEVVRSHLGNEGGSDVAHRVWLAAAVWLMIACGAPREAIAQDSLEGAAWRVTDTGVEATGIRALSGGDGVTTFVTRGGARALTTKPGSGYLYFDVDNSRTGNSLSPVYLVVEYFDDSPGDALTLEYDSTTGNSINAKYHQADARVGGAFQGTQQWKTAIFFLERPRFANRENLGADFRLSGGRPFVRSLQLTHTGPAGGSLEGAGWRVTEAGVEETGIHALSGGDGVTEFATRGGTRALTTKPGTSPPSGYLYFDVDDARAWGVNSPVYAVVEYFADSSATSVAGSVLGLEYDSATGDDIPARYRRAEDQAGGWAFGIGEWKTAIFYLERPQFANRQNLGADFRLGGVGLYVRAVQLTHQRPANWDEVQRLVRIGPGGQLIASGSGATRKSDAEREAQWLEAVIPLLKALGVTSIEVYVFWHLCEPEPGRYDWSVYDRFVAICQRSGLKWVPFLIAGPAYSLPDWYYKKPGSQGYVCLEHGLESDVQSLWNPTLRGHVARFIQAFCEHYRDSGVIESILLGVSGNYGEAIYPVNGTDAGPYISGPYHSHQGFWAGDPYAVESFRLWLLQKYGTVGRLANAWGSGITDIKQVRPFLRRGAPNDRAWLDFVDWYIGSMTEWARFWLHETRKSFPVGDIYLVTGGWATPEHGSNFGEQCKIAAEVGGGVRITNEASDYGANWSATRWVAAAGRQYGAYYSFEEAGVVSPDGVIARIYNATASGARGLHFYPDNLFTSVPAITNFARWGGQFQQRQPKVEIAVYYPQTHIKLNGEDFLGGFYREVEALRDRFDFDYMSDEQILDGGLKRIKALILLQGNVSEAPVWQAITNWVRAGGVMLYPDSMGRLRTVEGDMTPHEALFGPRASHGTGRVLTFPVGGQPGAYHALLARALANAPELSPETRAMVAADGEEDGFYVTLCAPRELLWFNETPQEARKAGPVPLVLPPSSIVSQSITPP
jgi:hypothetical protein